MNSSMPNLITESGLDPVEILSAKRLMLNLINRARADAGFNQVTLGNNPAAQFHACDMRAHCFHSHWGSDGLKPYMRYSFAGGTQNEAENVSGSGYCPYNPREYARTQLHDNIRKSMEGLMNSPGHRENILYPHHRKVNLGFSYRRPNLWVVQQFEGDYVTLDALPTIDNNGQLRFSATVKNGASINGQSTLIHIYYDRPPHKLTRGQLARTYSYTLKDLLAVVRKPASFFSFSPEYSMTASEPIHVDPYKLDPDLPPANSYEENSNLHNQSVDACKGHTQPYTVEWISAKRWNVSGTRISVSADIRHILQQNGNGVYTIVLWGNIHGENAPISQYSIFIPALPTPSPLHT